MTFVITSQPKSSTILSLCRVFSALMCLSAASMMVLLLSQTSVFNDVGRFAEIMANVSSPNTSYLDEANNIGFIFTPLETDKVGNSVSFNWLKNSTVKENIPNNTAYFNESHLDRAVNELDLKWSENRESGGNFPNVTERFLESDPDRSKINDSFKLLKLENSTGEANDSKSEVKLKENYSIVFIIPTHPRKVDTRQLIRQTWANVSAWSLLKDVDEEIKKIKLMFILGRFPSNKYSSNYSSEFNKELSQNRDDMFVVNDITDVYRSLRKKVIWGMNYSYHHFNFKYLVKTDDDVAVNLPVLLQALSRPAPGLRYTGYCVNKSGNKAQRFAYCSGGGYALSYDLLGHVLNLPSSVFNHTLIPEDAFPGWLVWNVNQLNYVYNTTQYSVRPKWAVRAFSLGRYKCGALRKWFYHGYKNTPIEFRLQQFHEAFMNNTGNECETVKR